eukprot:97208_1
MELLQAEHDDAESMAGQQYDGRILTDGTTKGWTLTAGDSILYYTNAKRITTKILKIRDKYNTLRLKNTVPISVLHSGAPPFWDTEIQLLPEDDPSNPVFYPLSQCLLVPSEINDEWERDMDKQRIQFCQRLENNGDMWDAVARGMYAGLYDDGGSLRQTNDDPVTLEVNMLAALDEGS